MIDFHKQPPTFIHVDNRIYALDYIDEREDGYHIYASKKYVEDSMKYNKSNRLDNFDAKEARRLSEKSVTNELQWVLQEIKRKAESDDNHDNILYIYHTLRKSTINELVSRGFNVAPRFSAHDAVNPKEYAIMW